MTSSRTEGALYRQLVAGWLLEASTTGLSLDELQARPNALWPVAVGTLVGELVRDGSVVLRSGRYYASAAGGSRWAGVVRNQTHAQREQSVTELGCSKGEEG